MTDLHVERIACLDGVGSEVFVQGDEPTPDALAAPGVYLGRCRHRG